MKIEFESAITSVTVEKGLSNLEGFKKRYEEAFEQNVEEASMRCVEIIQLLLQKD